MRLHVFEYFEKQLMAMFPVFSMYNCLQLNSSINNIYIIANQNNIMSTCQPQSARYIIHGSS